MARVLQMETILVVTTSAMTPAGASRFRLARMVDIGTIVWVVVLAVQMVTNIMGPFTPPEVLE